MSGSYLGKYNMDWNETWIIDRWEEVKCTRTIMLPWIWIKLSPLNHSSKMVACPAYVLESTKGIEIKLGIKIDVRQVQ